MKIYSAQHRAIVEAPMVDFPKITDSKYDLGFAYDMDLVDKDLEAYNEWLSTHIPVLPEHQALFKDGQEVENDIDYGVEGRWIIKPEDRYPNGDHKGIKTFVTVAIPIKQQQLPVEETWDDILETYHKELTNPIMRAKYVKAGQRLVDWLKQHYHVPIKQQVSEEDKEPLPQGAQGVNELKKLILKEQQSSWYKMGNTSNPDYNTPKMGWNEENYWFGYYRALENLESAIESAPQQSQAEPLPQQDGIQLDYPSAARAIALWLKPFCNEELPYPDIIADAARMAAKRIEALQQTIEGFKDRENAAWCKGYERATLKPNTLLSEALQTIAKYEQDVKDAAGELLVEIPEPGTEIAKLIHANIMLRKYRIPELEQKIKSQEAEIEKLQEVWKVKDETIETLVSRISELELEIAEGTGLVEFLDMENQRLKAELRKHLK